MNDKMVQFFEAQLRADRDFQLANFWYLCAIIGVLLTGAAFLTARIYQMASDRHHREHTGVYDPSWKPQDR